MKWGPYVSERQWGTVREHYSEDGNCVYRILGKHGMSRLPANQKYQPHCARLKRPEKLKPGPQLEMDVRFFERIPGHDACIHLLRIDGPTRIAC